MDSAATEHSSTSELHTKYLPYQQARSADGRKLVVVDSHYPRGLALSHFYEQRVPARLRSNTSTESTLKFLRLPVHERSELRNSAEFVTCNHWDIDGFLAVWSLVNPSIALRHADLLIAASELGDFRHFDADSELGRSALRLCALLNAQELQHFCRPFGNLDGATIEYQVAEKKFEFFLAHFAQWIERLEEYESSWGSEYFRVLSDLEYIDSGRARVENDARLPLTTIISDKPLHYYAAFSRARYGAVLTLLPGYDYAEFEYKYETRVGRVDRETLERTDLSELAIELTRRETNVGIQWKFDSLHEGGPMLRPESMFRPLSREERYQTIESRLTEGHPRTSIDFATLSELIEEALQTRRDSVGIVTERRSSLAQNI